MQPRVSSVIICLLGILASFLIASYFLGLFQQIQLQMELSKMMDVVERTTWVMEDRSGTKGEEEDLSTPEFEIALATVVEMVGETNILQYKVILLDESGDQQIFSNFEGSKQKQVARKQIASVIADRVVIFDFYLDSMGVGLDVFIPLGVFIIGSVFSIIFGLLHAQNVTLREQVLQLYEI